MDRELSAVKDGTGLDDVQGHAIGARAATLGVLDIDEELQLLARGIALGWGGAGLGNTAQVQYGFPFDAGLLGSKGQDGSQHLLEEVAIAPQVSAVSLAMAGEGEGLFEAFAELGNQVRQKDMGLGGEELQGELIVLAALEGHKGFQALVHVTTGVFNPAEALLLLGFVQLIGVGAQGGAAHQEGGEFVSIVLGDLMDGPGFQGAEALGEVEFGLEGLDPFELVEGLGNLSAQALQLEGVLGDPGLVSGRLDDEPAPDGHGFGRDRWAWVWASCSCDRS